MTIPSTDPASAPAGGSAAAEADAAPGRAHAPEQRTRRLALHFGAVLLVASSLAALVAGARGGVSAALGVTLAGVNLVLMQKITRAMTAGGGGASAAWGLALPFKLVALVGIAYVLVSTGVAEPVPLAMGFAILPLTGVFLPRPTSVPDPNPRPHERRSSSHPSHRGAVPSRHRQPAA